MEEILASIRRIISEDDAPGASDAEAADESPEHEAAYEPPPEPAHAPEPVHEDVLELTDRVEPEPAPAETVGDLDVHSRRPSRRRCSSPCTPRRPNPARV